MPETIQPTIYLDKCLNGTYITNLCANISDEKLFSRLRREIFDLYSADKAAKIFNGNTEYSLSVSNTLNEMKDKDNSNGLSLIDLGECEILLKKANDIPLDSELFLRNRKRKLMLVKRMFSLMFIIL